MSLLNDDANRKSHLELPVAGRSIKEPAQSPTPIYIQPPPSTQSSSLLPRNKRECCLVLIAIVAIISVAVGVGLGVGLYVSSYNNSAEADREVMNPQPGEVEQGDNNSGGDGNPSSSPTELSSLSIFGANIQTYLVSQSISDILSFENATTAQQQALDFIVNIDTIPMGLADEENETVSVSPSKEKNKDELSNNKDTEQQPYLSMSTPIYRVVQRYAMATLYYATEGEMWDANGLWLTPGVHECEWVGVICREMDIPSVTLADKAPDQDDILDDDENTVSERMVIEINLPENNLQGYLPREISGLRFLQTLGLWSNQIANELPMELGNLTNLQGLHLDDNNFEGTIPSTLGLLSEMQDLSLPTNNFRGEIPAEVFNLAKLQRLWIYNTQVTGSLPDDASYDNLTSLADLNLKNNKLDGSLPKGIQYLSSLQILDISSNQFTGLIPSSWKSLVNLNKIALNNNKLRGKIPNNIFQDLTKLESVSLDINQLSGTIPSAIIGATCNSLQKLTLGDNKLEGGLPESLRSCNSLRILEINSNQIASDLPTWIGELTNLEYLDVSDNRLSGDVPSQLSELSQIRELRLDGNFLEGTVPCPFDSASGKSVECVPLLMQASYFTNILELHCSICLCAVITSDCSPRGGTVTCSCCTRCS